MNITTQQAKKKEQTRHDDDKLDACQSDAIKQKLCALVALLKTCAKQKDLLKGSKLHCAIVHHSLLENNIYIANTLVSMYARCGSFAKTFLVFDQLPERSIITWTALITGYVEHGCDDEALKCFEWMQWEGLSPNAVTFSCVLKACGRISAIDKGEEIHDKISKEGLLRNDFVLGTSLLDMYVKCGALVKAQQVFNELPERDVTTWTALIAGYAQHGLDEKAITYFEQFRYDGFLPSAVTFAFILKVCGSMENLKKGEAIHAEILSKGLLAKASIVGDALVDMYVRCGELAKAQQVFEELPTQDCVSCNMLIAGYGKFGALVKAQKVFDNMEVHNVVSWTALMSSYSEHDHEEEVLSCLEQMQCEGICPNVVTFTCVVKACASIGALARGQQIYADIIEKGLLYKDCLLGSAVVDMYVRCGVLDKARKVFDELPVRHANSWTVLIEGYAQCGHHNAVFETFDQMTAEGIEPDVVTFSVMLGAFSFAGSVAKCVEFFEAMSSRFDIIPTIEHCTCLVTVLGNVGNFDKMMGVVTKMPSSGYLPVWIVVLGACLKWGNVELGRWAFEKAIKIDKMFPLPYLRMINIYIAAGMQQEAAWVEHLSKKNESQKIRKLLVE